MAEVQNFRSAFNGFNREDVVHYIEYINNRHNAERNQLLSQLQTAEEELAALRGVPAVDEETLALLAETTQRLEQSQQQCAALEAELAEVREQLAAAAAEQSRLQTEEELAAYRRAERAERVANERVNQLYAQANGALADATVKVDTAADQVAEAAEAVIAQLSTLQTAVIGSKNSLRDAAAALYAVRPVSEEV